MRKIAFLLGTAMALSAQAQNIVFDLSSPQYLKKEVSEVLGLLPADYFSAVKGDIRFKVEKLDSDSAISSDLCIMGEGARFAFTQRKPRSHEITVSHKLLLLAISNPKTFDCSHGSFKKFLQATLLHELTHVKDNFEKISSEPDFQRMIGVRHLQSSKLKIMNQNTGNSPDAYEFKNAEEALAVNTEFLLLDDDFECRKPAIANYLSQKLKIPLKKKCEQNYKIIAQSAFLEDNYQYATSIDPNRVYQIHYLFAGKGQSLMSRWGHAMFRLVVCAPHRKHPGPECLSDVSHHLALSYRAYMNDMSINYAKGMFGGYPSQLFIFRFHEVQQEYNKFELRDLHSAPIKLTESQKKEFLDLTLERYWSYQGKYYFLDNNCGTETKKHMAVALEDEQSKLIRSVTPLKIFRDITKEENNILDGETQFIPSLFEEIEKSYEVLSQAGIFTERSFKKFMKQTSAESRYRVYERFFQNYPSLQTSEGKNLVMRLIFFERYLTTKFMMEVPKKAFQKIDKDKELRDEVMKMGESLKTLFIQPWEIVPSRYGVPSKEEFVSFYRTYLEKRKQTLKLSAEMQLSQLESILQKPTFRSELQEIEEMKKIKTLMNELFNTSVSLN